MSLIAHQVVTPARAALARAAAAALLGGEPATRRPVVASTVTAVRRRCRDLPAPAVLLAAAEQLRAVSIGEAEEFSRRLRHAGLTEQPVPAAAVLRLLSLWDLLDPPVRLTRRGDSCYLLSAAAEGWLRDLRALLRRGCGPVLPPPLDPPV